MGGGAVPGRASNFVCRTGREPGRSKGMIPVMDIQQFVDETALAAAYWDHVEALIARHDRALDWKDCRGNLNRNSGSYR